MKAALDDSGLRASEIDGYCTVGGDRRGRPHARDAAPLVVQPGDDGSGVLVRRRPVDHGGGERTMRHGDDHPHYPATAHGWCPPPSQCGRAGHGRPWARSSRVFGAGSPTQWAGLLTQRRMFEYKETEEHYAAHVVAQRYHASLNDDAIFRDPLTPEEYLAAATSASRSGSSTATIRWTPALR